MARTVEDFAQSCLGQLPPAILSDVETREILTQFYTVVGYVEVNDLDPIRDSLPALLDPDTCPVVALDGLLSMCGFSAGVSWAASSSVTLKRNLCRLAAQVWRQKGLPDGNHGLVRTLCSGNDAVIWDWSFWRFIEGAAVPFLGWTDTHDAGDCEASFHLSDPYDTCERDLVERALEFIQPATDTWSLVWCLFAEGFLQGLYQWSVTGSATTENGECSICDGDSIETRMGASWEVERVLASLLRFGSSVMTFKWGVVDASNYYEAAVSATGVTVSRIVAGVPTVVCTGLHVVAPTVDLASPRWYLVDIRAQRTTWSTVEVQVFLEGELVCAGTVL